MQEQTRVISQNFMEFVEEHKEDSDALLEAKQAVLEIIKKDAIEAMVNTEMDSIIRDCIIARRMNLSYAVFLEKFIERLETLFEEG